MAKQYVYTRAGLNAPLREFPSLEAAMAYAASLGMRLFWLRGNVWALNL